MALNGQAEVAVAFGSGDDRFAALGTEEGLTVKMGGGRDRVDFADLANIAEFDVTTDVLALTTGTITRIALANPQQDSVERAASLFAAVSATADFANTDEAVVFDYGGNAYIYVENDTAGFYTGDGLLELVGVSADDLGGVNLLI